MAAAASAVPPPVTFALPSSVKAAVAPLSQRQRPPMFDHAGTTERPTNSEWTTADSSPRGAARESSAGAPGSRRNRRNPASSRGASGWSASALQQVESAGAMWYNGLEVSLTKRFSSGLQFLASYTWSKTLDTDGANVVQNSGAGSAIGEQYNDRQRYGPASFSRPQRFILSYVYQLPWLKSSKGAVHATLAGWSVAGVTTFQAGQPLTILATNTNNVFGITTTSGDRAQIAAGCTYGQLQTAGSVTSRILNYFNASCFAKAPVIGSDNVGTGFGNSGVGIVRGPAQNNFDISLAKQFPLRPERLALQFRAEFFNAFNTPQFASPDATFTDPAFGQITATSVSPRLIQLALKVTF